MFCNEQKHATTVKHSASNYSNSAIFDCTKTNPTEQPFFPIQLIIEANTRAQIINTSKHLIEFFDIGIPKSPHQTQRNECSIRDLPQRNKIIKHLNFIRFTSAISTSECSTVLNEISEEISSDYSNSEKINVPNLSLILLTNTNRQNSLNDSKLNKNTWSYHHQIELNDENGATIARQIFYKLNSDSIKFPLCCRSNWVPPLFECHSSQNSVNLINSQKYIVRLNINCKNYELMIFFYRLLFDKCKNFSKKDFSVFVLNQNENIEMQLSLKHHNLDRVNVNNFKNTKLVYNVMSREIFENILRLLDGFVEEIVKNKVYTVLDPDRNRVILIDCSARKKMTETGLGLGDVYLSSLLNNYEFNDQQFSPSSSSCSSSETNSFDGGSSSSGKDSGRWSCSINSNNNYNNNANMNLNKLKNISLTRTMSMNKPYISDYISNQVNNYDNQSVIAENQARKKNETGNFENNLRRHKSNRVNTLYDTGCTRGLPFREAQSDRVIINQFQSSVPVKSTRKTSRNKLDLADADGDDEYDDNDEDIDFEEKRLKNLLKKSSKFSINALNAIAYKHRLGQKLSSSKLNNKPRFRSQSVLNEPYVYPQAKKSSFLKSTIDNNANNNSENFCDGLEINRKKSKSVTFMDCMGGSSRIPVRNIRNEKIDIRHRKQFLPPRSKSTTPCSSIYNQYNYMFPNFESDDLIVADVDDFNDVTISNKFRNCLIEPISKESFPQLLNLKKPNVGITPQTRFRRAHTLDLIRSTRMPFENSANVPPFKRASNQFQQIKSIKFNSTF